MAIIDFVQVFINDLLRSILIDGVGREMRCPKKLPFQDAFLDCCIRFIPTEQFFFRKTDEIHHSRRRLLLVQPNQTPTPLNVLPRISSGRKKDTALRSRKVYPFIQAFHGNQHINPAALEDF